MRGGGITRQTADSNREGSEDSVKREAQRLVRASVHSKWDVWYVLVLLANLLLAFLSALPCLIFAMSEPLDDDMVAAVLLPWMILGCIVALLLTRLSVRPSPWQLGFCLLGLAGHVLFALYCLDRGTPNTPFGVFALICFLGIPMFTWIFLLLRLLENRKREAISQQTGTDETVP